MSGRPQPRPDVWSSYAEELLRDAGEFDRIRQQEQTPRILEVHAWRTGVHAAKQIIEAEDHGSGLMRGFAPRPVGRLVERPDSDSSLFWYWVQCACTVLRGTKPTSFCGAAGSFDFPAVKTDNEKRVLGRDGKPVKIVDENGRVLKSKTEMMQVLERGGTISTTEAACVTDDYDEAQGLSHGRAQCRDWADACRAAAKLLRERVDAEPSPGARKGRGNPGAPKKHGDVEAFVRHIRSDGQNAGCKKLLKLWNTRNQQKRLTLGAMNGILRRMKKSPQ